MKRILFLATILVVAGCGIALAQEEYDLSARGVEPARARTAPYHTMAEAVKGLDTPSRYIAAIEEPTRSEGGSAVTFTTHFAYPVNWLNRQIILRIGYASTAYTVYINGREVGYAPTGAIGCEFNITKASKEGRNEISIMLDKSSPANKIYESKEVKLGKIEVFSQPTIRIRDIVSKVVVNEGGDGIAEFAIPVKCDALNPKEMRMRYTLRLGDSLVLADGYREMALDMRREDTIRFACILPAKALWSAKMPTMLRLDLESRIEERIVECISRNIGVRQLTLRKGECYINNEKAELNLVEWESIKTLNKVVKAGYNGIIITLDRDAEKVIEECNRRGLYVVVRTPIDTTLLGDHIRRGGNPSNDPRWNESYLWRNVRTLQSTILNSSVIGYAIARGTTSGINIYDTYLLMKRLAPNHLIIYEGAQGEWATDK